ncbi:MAG: hypothetical protein EOP84_23450 [Verrucomicrobiaceae bacterium]|nr:MAG: hypothetical protein EOP84_23450 [Verrucomicrobiaceae bacterium]
MLWIISGPSSVGKSTFLASQRCYDLTGGGPDALTRFAFEQDPALSEHEDSFFHYNLLRPASRFRREHSPPPLRWYQLRTRFRRLFDTPPLASSTRALQQGAQDFSRDPAWANLVASPTPKKAIVLVADQDRILERVRSRTKVEEEMPSGLSNTYRPTDWLWFYERLDLAELYRAWYAELARCGIEYLIVDSNDSHFRLLENS